MNNITTIKLAESIKPPAKQSEIIEALAIRKRVQIIEENAKLGKELVLLEAKLQVVCAEEMVKSGKPKKGYNGQIRYSCHASEDNAGRRIVSNIDCDYTCPPSEEIRNIAKRIREIRMTDRREPSLNEVKRQVRAAISDQTQPDRRVHTLLNDPESQKMLDVVLDALDKKPRQAALVA